MLHLVEIDLSVNEFSYQGYKSPSFPKDGIDPTIERFTTNVVKSSAILEALSATLVIRNEATKTMTESLQQDFLKMNKNFQQLINLLRKRGFKDYGLEGRFEKSHSRC